MNNAEAVKVVKQRLPGTGSRSEGSLRGQPWGPRPWLVLCTLCLPVGFTGGAEPDPRRDAVVEVVNRVMPAVVNIGTETIVAVRDPFDELLREWWGPYYRRRPPEAKQYSLGSGVIIDEAGYVLTNDHVVRRADRIWVKIAQDNGGKEYLAKVVAGSQKADVALLKIEAKAGERFTAVRFGVEDDLLLGETVLALGNPFGLGGSVSRGILSSKSRRPPLEQEPLDLADWLQTDAAINPGSSGGPLINLRGELIGLNVAVYREGQGIGFAIPIKRVLEAVSEMFSPELQQLWFGARVRPVGPALIVAHVEPGSPAEKAGLKAGDVVVEINGRRPRGYIEFVQELNSAGDRRDVNLVLLRGNARQTATARLVRETTVFNANLIRQKLGLTVQEITADLQQRYRLIADEGLLITAVDREGPAAEAGLQRGYILIGLDGQATPEVVATAKTLYGKRKGEKVGMVLLIPRQRGMVVMPERWGAELRVR